jgi:tetratricopeptide (TPR) repeat protein
MRSVYVNGCIAKPILMRVLLLIIVVAAMAAGGLYFFRERKSPLPPPTAAEITNPTGKPEATGSISGVLKDLNGNVKLTRNMTSRVQENEVYPMHYLILVSEAMKSFQVRDFAGALLYAEKADAVLPPTVWTLNIRGAVAIEQHEYEKGLNYCSEALKMEPGFFPAQFNLCEIPFLQGKYAEARSRWETILKKISPDDSTKELLIYRIFLTYVLEKDFVHAKDWLERLPFPGQTPAHYYANACWERQKGNKGRWEEYLQSAEFIWPESKRAPFVDVLLQLKWILPSEFTLK